MNGPTQLSGTLPQASPGRDALSQRVDRASAWLRMSGVVAVLAAASSFMLQRWEEGAADDMRYLYLLAHGVMLFVGAIFCGAKMKESRTARTFLLLTLSTLPACFAVLGGLVLSRFPWEPLDTLPQYATWQAHSDVTALLWVALTVGLGWILTRLSCRALAPRNASAIAGSFVGMQLLLLVPLRDATYVGPLLVVGVGALLWLERGFRTRSEMRTFEGQTIRLLYWLVPLMMLARATAFYELKTLLFGCVMLALGGVAFSFGIRLTGSRFQAALESLGAVFAVVGLGVVGLDVKHTLFPNTPLHLLSSVPLSFALLGFSEHAGPARSFLRGVAGVSATALSIAAVLVNGGIAAGIGALFVGVGCVALGLLGQRKVWIAAGAVCCALGLGGAVESAIGISSLFNWGSLTALGVMSLMVAALVERYRGRIVARMEQAQRRERARDTVARAGRVAPLHHGVPLPVTHPENRAAAAEADGRTGDSELQVAEQQLRDEHPEPGVEASPDAPPPLQEVPVSVGALPAPAGSS